MVTNPSMEKENREKYIKIYTSLEKQIPESKLAKLK
jgi:hypothetical protein